MKSKSQLKREVTQGVERSIEDILVTGAGWITENELERVCNLAKEAKKWKEMYEDFRMMIREKD